MSEKDEKIKKTVYGDTIDSSFVFLIKKEKTIDICIWMW